MKTILKIFTSDMKGLFKNKLALAIAVGICILPSLYAWFNIYSNWNPYGNTALIKVAVASDDKGYTLENGTFENMGNSVIESLKENDKIGWTFVDSEEAVAGVKSGEYYAAIVIGEDFSSSMYDFAGNDLQRPHVTYYENEKKNAVASKITDTAKGTLQSNINSEFITVAVETVMETMNELSDDARESQYVANLMEKLQSVHDNLDDYLVTLDALMECNRTLSSNLSDAGSKVTGASGKITSGANQVAQANKTAQDTITTLSTDLDQVITQLKTQLQTTGSRLSKPDITQEDIDAAKEALENSDTLLGSLSGLIDNPLITDTVTKDSIANLINSIQTTTSAASNAIHQGISDNATLAAAANLINAVMPIVENQLKNDINTIKSNINAAYQSMTSSLNSLNNGLADTGAALNSLSGTIAGSNTSFTGLKEIIISANDEVETLISELAEVEESERYDRLLSILGSNPEEYGTFFASPVEIETVPVYEISNYGSSVTPFYTILALWVGAVILVAIIKVKVDDKEKYPGAGNHQLYFGRFLLFLVLGQFQALVVVLGDLYLLRVQCKEPLLFYFAAAFASFTFNLLIYTLTVSFGDVGKALVVVVMVIQIAGSSGTYPIEILPAFYQKVYVYFPFPYAINAMRETIGGLYENDYWADLSQLAVFALLALLIGLFVRKPFMKINHFVEKRMEDTKMM